MKKLNNFCPCGSHKLYSTCCGAYINGHDYPNTPEALMRSRYSAYVKSEVEYLKKTMRGAPLEQFNSEEVLDWLKNVRWQGLKIKKKSSAISSQSIRDIAYVEFVAEYKYQGRNYELREISKFSQQEGHWFYTGEHELDSHTCSSGCAH